jgi:acetyl-CoA carboxylase carboxyl transferase subunit beta
LHLIVARARGSSPFAQDPEPYPRQDTRAWTPHSNPPEVLPRHSHLNAAPPPHPPKIPPPPPKKICAQSAAKAGCGCASAATVAAPPRLASCARAGGIKGAFEGLGGPINVSAAAAAAAGFFTGDKDKAGKAAAAGSSAAATTASTADRSKGLWTRCDKCGVILYVKHLKEHHHICFGCNYHLKMTSAERVEHLIDPGTWRPLDELMSAVDPLEFADQKPYPDRVRDSQLKTGMQDAIRTGTGLLHGIPVALAVMEFGFMGGSMGSVVGEKLTRLIEYATQEGLTLLVVCTSGGARMQEGIFSLMQMAKISAALHVHQNCANLLYVAILTSPTTGGVTASFGMLGDVIVAEPQAIIGFAGRRVIEQTLNEELPDDFQTAEYLLDKGLLDLVVPRSFMKGALYEIIDFYRAAPFKRRGAMPFGVQRGTYGLTAEEKMRRRFREWTKDAEAAIEAPAGGAAAGSAPPAFDDLVASYTTLCAAGEAASELDVADAVRRDPELLQQAVDLAKGSVVEWVEAQDALLSRSKDGKTKEGDFVFRVKPLEPALRQ